MRGSDREFSTFWRADIEECPECGSAKVFTNGKKEWCGPCGWRREVA